MDTNSLTQTRCVIFDLDGTIVDSAPDITISLNLVLQELNYPSCNLAQVREWIGNGAARLIKRALTGQIGGEPSEELFQHAHNLFFDRYAQHLCEESEIYPGVLEGLNALNNRSLNLACVTNKPRRFAPALLQTLKLDQFFEHLICGDDLPAKKPDPLPLLTILEKNKLQPSQALVVGDSASDIQAAKAANMNSFCVSYGYHQGKGVDALGANYIIDSVAELVHYI